MRHDAFPVSLGHGHHLEGDSERGAHLEEGMNEWGKYMRDVAQEPLSRVFAADCTSRTRREKLLNSISLSLNVHSLTFLA